MKNVLILTVLIASVCFTSACSQDKSSDSSDALSNSAPAAVSVAPVEPVQTLAVDQVPERKVFEKYESGGYGSDYTRGCVVYTDKVVISHTQNGFETRSEKTIGTYLTEINSQTWLEAVHNATTEETLEAVYAAPTLSYTGYLNQGDSASEVVIFQDNGNGQKLLKTGSEAVELIATIDRLCQ